MSDLEEYFWIDPSYVTEINVLTNGPSVNWLLFNLLENMPCSFLLPSHVYIYCQLCIKVMMQDIDLCAS